MNHKDYPILESLTNIFLEDNDQEEKRLTSEDIADIVELQIVGLNDDLFYDHVISCTRPIVNIEEVAVETMYGNKAYVAGKHSYEPLVIEVGEGAADIIQQQLGVQNDVFMNGEPQPYKFNLQLDYANYGDQGENTKWNFEGCFIQSVDYADLGHDTQMTVTIRYDHTKMQ